MVVSNKTKGGVVFVPKKRDIIPPDFFSDLSKQVECLLADEPGLSPLGVQIGDAGLGMTSPQRSPGPGRNTMVGIARQRAAAYGKEDDPWGVGATLSTASSPTKRAGRQTEADFQDTIKGKQQKVASADSGPSAQEEKLYSPARPGEELDVTLAPSNPLMVPGNNDEDELRAFFREQTKDALQDTFQSNAAFEDAQVTSASPGKPDGTATLRMNAQEPDSPYNNETMPAARMTTPFKYIFEPSSRFTPIDAGSHEEGIERLRQYLVMKYGSMNRAWYKLEHCSIDVTGLGFRHDLGGAHVEGMLQYSEFVHAVKFLIPNWAEVTGVGQLGKLFKSIDFRDTGFIRFADLMGCKMDDEIANIEFNFCPSRPMQHCPFTAPMRHPPWNIKPNRTCNLGETFEAAKREHGREQDDIMRKRQPIFVPISQMPIHHHQEAQKKEDAPAELEDDGPVGLVVGRSASIRGKKFNETPSAVVMQFYDEATHTWANSTNEKQEEDDAVSWMSSDAHSSEQELDLHHIKLRLRAAGLSNNINWRKLFHHYDPKHMGEIDWFEFRSMIRRDVQLTPDILSEEDLKRLFYSVDVVKEALGDSIFYEAFLEWLEPAPTKEELAELKAEIRTTVRHQRGHRFHKSPLLRNLEVERRHEAENHHDHMSCNPCTKMCPVCRKVVLLSGWAPHKYACQRKARQVLEKDHKEIEYLKKWNFQPKITAKGKRTRGTHPDDLHVAEREKDRFPIREARNRAHYDEWQEIQNKEMTFQPQLNDQTRQIFRMVHQDGKEWHDRLHLGTPTHKLVGKVERKKNCQRPTKPQITVRGIQHGIERGPNDIYHRLHHGPPEIATHKDPNIDMAAEEAVAQLTAKLEKSAKPVGIGESSWSKVKAVQAMASMQTLAKKSAQGIVPENPLLILGKPTQGEAAPSPSPATTGFSVGGTPGSLDAFVSSPTSATPMTLSARSPRPEPGATLGGVAALSGRLRASLSEKSGGSTMSTTLGNTPLTATTLAFESPADSTFSPFGRTLPPAKEGADEDAATEEPEDEDDDEGTVVTATPKLMSLLHRCDMMRNMVIKKREQAKKSP